MIQIGMSTSSAYPLTTEHAFRLAGSLGFDGVEIMVTNDEDTQTPDALLALAEEHRQPILSIHAPVLLLTHFVWGREPRVKLEKSAELAREVGARTVVAHPPFRWQKSYSQDFVRIVREVSAGYGVEIAVENMFPWKVAGRGLKAYHPGWDPSLSDYDAMTLDFSHASLSGRDSLDLADSMGSRLRHVHLSDGTGSMDDQKVFDEHLVPGRGNEPIAEVLALLTRRAWSGSVIAEINTRKARSEDERVELLRETLDFARNHLASPTAVPAPKSALRAR